MGVRLRPLSDDEFADWRRGTEEWYAADLVASGGLSEEEARRKSNADHASLFPDGRPTADDAIFVVEDDDGAAVGTIFFRARELRGVRRGFVYALEISEAARGRGYGRRAMELVEDEMRKQGLGLAELNVFGGNEVARSLYRSLGYSELAVTMVKTIG